MPNKEQILNNGVFCVLPWTHLAIATDGQPRPCSWQTTLLKVGDDEYNVETHDILEHGNLEPIKNLKENMLNGIKSNYCNRCYEQEELTGVSKRVVETFSFQKEDAERIASGENVPIKELEFRLGNMCNLGCVSCSPHSSSFFVKEINKTNTDIKLFKENFQNQYKKYNSMPVNWYENSDFWEKIETYLENVNYIYLAGGEPTIIKENWKFLEKVVELGYAKNIKLGISTNLTNVQPKHVEIYNSFKKTLIYSSIDGYGIVNDYLRYPSKWAAIGKNLEKLCVECNSNVEFKVIPVINIFTVWSIEKLCDYIDELKTKTNANIEFSSHTLLRDPDYMSIKNLPDDAKEDMLSIVERLAKRYDKNDFQIERLHNYIKNNIGKGDTNVFKNGKKYVEEFDKMRHNSWQDAIPELKKYWIEDNVL